ncbi:hypothetical protein J421_2126 [Gemmatirosa kalamazoonensis]|uniref:Uncharacterized protein n=1 Tax=Gemmatirosa kalamazoonensis TaxID=861299 RepID=W0RJS3_9BACT|nr:hypothetical protein J421_2126 [Gemmatirosa kalamazoonensis]
MSGAGTEVTAAQWLFPLVRDVSATALIGPEGGTLELPETGLRLVVPADVVGEPTPFRVTARAGRLVAYDFEPEGSEFTPSLRFEQDPSLLEPPPLQSGRPMRMQLGYYEHASAIDETNGVATVTEVHYPIEDGARGTFAVPHFSDYVVCWGTPLTDADDATVGHHPPVQFGRVMRKHLFAGLVAVVAAMTAAACADAPSAPTARPNPVATFAKGGNGNGKGLGLDKSDGSSIDSIVAYLATLHDTVSRETQSVKGMQRLSPLTSMQSASAVIGVDGGMVQLPTAGAYLWVPPGAVSAPTTFSITARPGKAAAYDFQPAGAVFALPLVFIQDKTVLNGTAPTGFTSGALAYFGNDADVDPSTANATASQMRFPLAFSTDQYLTFPIWHFSGYIVSWGCR